MKNILDLLDRDYTVVNRATGAEYQTKAPTREAALWEVARLYNGKEWLEWNQVEVYDGYMRLGQFIVTTERG